MMTAGMALLPFPGMPTNRRAPVRPTKPYPNRRAADTKDGAGGYPGVVGQLRRMEIRRRLGPRRPAPQALWWRLSCRTLVVPPGVSITATPMSRRRRGWVVPDKPGVPGTRWCATIVLVNLLDELQWRGLVQDCTDPDGLRKHLASGPVTFYVGFDPTAASLHLGHLVQVVTARRLQLAGHRPLLLVGGATGQIGDPKESGERTLNPPEVVAEWVNRIRAQLAPFLRYEGDHAATTVNNLDWTGPLSAIDFLRDVGKHFPVNRMLARDVVKARLESGISFTELSYQLLQSHDFYELHRRYGCTLQFGGSDQWGNITAGVDYVRRRGGGPVHAFTTPLVTKSDGTKFGKTESGAIWLDPALTSAYVFYQFWVNVDDADVGRYLRYFSFRDHDALAELEKATQLRPAAREAQRALAQELTVLVHGDAECTQAAAASEALFGRGSLAGLGRSTLASALAEAGLVSLPKLASVAVLFKEAGLVASMNEARRTIGEGGAYINNQRVTDPEQLVDPHTLLYGRYLVLRRGRRTIAGIALATGRDLPDGDRNDDRSSSDRSRTGGADPSRAADVTGAIAG